MSYSQGPRTVLEALFDFSFSEFITPRIAKGVYLIIVVGAAALTLVTFLTGLSRSPLAGLAALATGLFMFAVIVVIARIWLEVAVVFFRIAETTTEIAEHDATIAINTAKAETPGISR